MKPLTVRMLLTIVVCTAILVEGSSGAQDASAKRKRPRRRNPALAPIEDNPKLPRVLLIGDSISIGYTLPTRTLLTDEANVHRIPANGGPTIRGLANLDAWLGEGRWDVIHFNWGLHDLKMMDGHHQVPLKEYEENLRKLVKRLKKTQAKLIWCSTTPVPENVNPPRKNSDVLEYNAVARRIMQEHDIAINDLYTFADKRLTEIQRPNNVHFTPDGSRVLAQQVARSIRAALDAKSPTP